MKIYYTYYLVDTLSETIVGSFNAISDMVAKKMVYETLKKNPTLQDMEDCLKLYRSESSYDVAETFDEILDLGRSSFIDLAGVFADVK